MRHANRWPFAGAMLVAVGLLAAGCASGGSSVLSQTQVSAEELATADYQTVYDFLRAHSRVRFQSRGGQESMTVYGGGSLRMNTQTGAMLIVDNQEVKGNVPAILRQMPLARVASLRILRATEASTRYGGSGRVGAVVIETKESGGG